MCGINGHLINLVSICLTPGSSPAFTLFIECLFHSEYTSALGVDIMPLLACFEQTFFLFLIRKGGTFVLSLGETCTLGMRPGFCLFTGFLFSPVGLVGVYR